MKVIRAAEFKPNRPWGALAVALMDGISVKLHWTDQPYHWHVNDGEEVFAVLEGVVDMHYRAGGVQDVATLAAGDIFFADVGTEHLARPRGEARVLVIEKADSR